MRGFRYFRKTATYTVVSQRGQELLVDEFVASNPSGAPAPLGLASRCLMLRDGDEVSLLPDGAMNRTRTGERLDVIGTEAN